MSGGGSRTPISPGPGPGPSDPCGIKYEAELKDWLLQVPGANVVRALPDPSPVIIQPDPKDNTIQVFDTKGVKLGHLVHTMLKRCLGTHNYDAVFFRKGQTPWVRATKKP